jgi:hypothetical protein
VLINNRRSKRPRRRSQKRRNSRRQRKRRPLNSNRQNPKRSQPRSKPSVKKHLKLQDRSVLSDALLEVELRQKTKKNLNTQRKRRN